jgi:serine/threonine-protein kinase
MPADQTVTLFERLKAADLLDAAQLEELSRLPEASNPDPRALGNVLLRRNLLTRYQINQLAQGRGASLRVGPYLVLDRLGEGGMGQVFRARHHHMQRIVALKLIRQDKSTKEEAVKRFYQEFQAAGQLHHPNIVLAFDAGPAGNTHYFAMEYVDGTDLAKLVSEAGPLPAGQACEYARQAATGLQHAHERGLVHRDIKPANLLVTNQSSGPGVVKLLDLGLARSPASGPGKSDLTKTGQVMGTPDYLAPEQAIDARSADARSDLYSLGCTLFYLLCGRPPFTGGSLAQVLLQHQVAEIQLPPSDAPGVPQGVWTVVRKLMAKRPEDRYQSAAEVIQALAPWCDAGISSAAPHQNGVRATPPSESVWGTISGDESDDTTRRARKASGSSTARSATQKISDVRPGALSNRKIMLIAGSVVAACVLLLIVLLFIAFSRHDTKATKELAAGTSPGGEARSSAQPPRVPAAEPARPLKPQNDGPAPMRRNPRPPGLETDFRVAPVPRADVPVSKKSVLVYGGEHKSCVSVAISADGRYGWFTQSTLRWGYFELPAIKSRPLRVERGFGINSQAFSPDGHRVVTASPDRSLRLWDLNSGALVRTFRDVDQGTKAIVFSPDGKLVATARSNVKPITGKTQWFDCGIRLWDVATGKKLQDWDWQDHPPDQLGFSPKGDRITAVNNQDASVHVYDIATGAESSNQQLARRAGGPSYSQLSRDGRYLLSSGSVGTSYIWDTDAKLGPMRLEQPGAMKGVGWSMANHALTVSVIDPDDNAKSSELEVREWNPDTGELLRRLIGEGKSVFSLAASADGKRVLVGDCDGNARLFIAQ